MAHLVSQDQIKALFEFEIKDPPSDLELMVIVPYWNFKLRTDLQQQYNLSDNYINDVVDFTFENVKKAPTSAERQENSSKTASRIHFCNCTDFT